MDQSQSATDARVRMLRQHCRRIPSLCDDPPHAQTPYETNCLFMNPVFAHGLFENYDAIIEATCEAWNNLMKLSNIIKSIGIRQWAHIAQSE